MDNRAAAAHRDAAAEPLLDVRALKKYYPVTSGFFQRKQGTVRAVDDVSFTIYKGETFGLVGESGCGKSTLGRCILRLQEPTSGEVLFEGRNILTLSNRAMNSIRRKMQIVFQDPYSSLNPRMTVWQTLHEPLFLHGITGRSVIRKRVLELLDLVGLGEHHLHRFPHEFSGGQRQRIGIARALALHPQLIVCDEPVSALDVSVQSQVLNLLSDLQAELGLTYLFIAHDLSVVRHISDRIGVMYLGRFVELSPSTELYEHPLHPYSQALISAIPLPNPKQQRTRERIVLQGDLPTASNPPSGCAFHTRCPYVQPRCREEIPAWRKVEHERWVACHYPLYTT